MKEIVKMIVVVFVAIIALCRTCFKTASTSMKFSDEIAQMPKIYTSETRMANIPKYSMVDDEVRMSKELNKTEKSKAMKTVEVIKTVKDVAELKKITETNVIDTVFITPKKEN